AHSFPLPAGQKIAPRSAAECPRREPRRLRRGTRSASKRARPTSKRTRPASERTRPASIGPSKVFLNPWADPGTVRLFDPQRHFPPAPSKIGLYGPKWTRALTKQLLAIVLSIAARRNRGKHGARPKTIGAVIFNSPFAALYSPDAARSASPTSS